MIIFHLHLHAKPKLKWSGEGLVHCSGLLQHFAAKARSAKDQHYRYFVSE